MKTTVKSGIRDNKLFIDAERDGSTMGVDMPLPVDSKTLEAACCVLIANLAGISEAELYAAGALALVEAGH
jgi:hypothetical protein